LSAKQSCSAAMGLSTHLARCFRYRSDDDLIRLPSLPPSLPQHPTLPNNNKQVPSSMQHRRIVLGRGGQRPVLHLAMVCLVVASLLPSAAAFLLPSLPTAAFSSSLSSSASSVNGTFSIEGGFCEKRCFFPGGGRVQTRDKGCMYVTRGGKEEGRKMPCRQPLLPSLPHSLPPQLIILSYDMKQGDKHQQQQQQQYHK